MNVLDVTVVSVALPDMGAALGASLSELQWVVNAYTLPLGTLLMSAATLSGSVGRLRLFRWGVVLFTAGSLVCALAPSVGVLDWSRFIQGVGGAIFLGVGVPMISDRYQAGPARARAARAAGTDIVFAAGGPSRGVTPPPWHTMSEPPAVHSPHQAHSQGERRAHYPQAPDHRILPAGSASFDHHRCSRRRPPLLR